jgi:hypothetical protein
MTPDGRWGTADATRRQPSCVRPHFAGDGRFSLVETRDQVRAYCCHHYIPAERVEAAELPLWLTKRGVLVR